MRALVFVHIYIGEVAHWHAQNASLEWLSSILGAVQKLLSMVLASRASGCLFGHPNP